MQNAHPVEATLTSARTEFSQGNLEAARQRCAAILNAFPDQADALHLLGVIEHQSGDEARAREFLRRAAESPETLPVYLLTYAELCCKGVDDAMAVEITRHAVALNESLPFSWFYLGSLLLESRQFTESRECFERTLALDDEFWRARVNLGIVQGRQGEAGVGASQFEHLLREQSGNAEVLGNHAAFLRDQGRYEEALTQAEAAIAKQPDALDHHLRAVEIDMLRGRHGDALARLDAMENKWSGDAKCLTLRAHLLRLVDRYDEAVLLCRDAFAKGVESAELTRAFGLALHLAGNHDEALLAFDRATIANPAAALSDKGVLLSQLGRLTEARETFDQALSHDPRSADAWYNKANARSHAAGDPDIAAMRAVISEQGVYRDRLLLHFALGKAFMDAGDATQAFAHWHEGNRMKRATIDYDGEAAAKRMTEIAARSMREPATQRADAHLSADQLSDAPVDRAHGDAHFGDARLSDVPVFIVGMPRCGSSLVEQILASHPDVYGAGELLQLRPLFESEDPDRPVAELALQRMRRFSPLAARIVDKDLSNFLHLGAIHPIFPRARIIHCRRDPLDTCYSAYSKLFVGENAFTYDMRELGLYYRSYHELMAHWRGMLGKESFLEIDYESLVSDPGTETRRLIAFLGLPWNDDCLRFFETERVVNTASFTQVRQPMYRSSIGGARALRSHLQPLISALGDLARI
jgi:tetratricopeptide (TPR) repeat protein